MVVYAVMRSVQLIGLFTTKECAQQEADAVNAIFKRGARTNVIEMKVHAEARLASEGER